ncbi:MAG: hypothetical protein ACK47B_28745 [Armatimonadota bacterium]
MGLSFGPGACAFYAIMIAFVLVFRLELRRRRWAALPYLGAYWIASTFYGVFFLIWLDGERTIRNWNGVAGYLIFTTAVLLLGLLLHWRACARRPSAAGMRRPLQPEK